MMCFCSSPIFGSFPPSVSLNLYLPLFRVLLTTAHMLHICTVIRFSPSRFVPPNKRDRRPPSSRSSLTGCWSVTIPADRGANPSSCAFPSTERSSPFFPRAASWTLICTLLVNYELSLLPLFHPWLNFLSSLFLSFLFCCVMLRWSSPDMTIAFSLESSPTPSRDAFWR